MGESKRVDFLIPVVLLTSFDEWWSEQGYANRTVAIHEAMRKLMKNAKKEAP